MVVSASNSDFLLVVRLRRTKTKTRRYPLGTAGGEHPESVGSEKLRVADWKIGYGVAPR